MQRGVLFSRWLLGAIFLAGLFIPASESEARIFGGRVFGRAHSAGRAWAVDVPAFSADFFDAAVSFGALVLVVAAAVVAVANAVAAVATEANAVAEAAPVDNVVVADARTANAVTAVVAEFLQALRIRALMAELGK